MGRLKYLAGLAAALVLFSGMRAGAAEPALSAKSAALLSGATGAVLWERQGREPLPMASTTKIMTALLALEAAEDLGDPVVTITQEMTQVEGSSMGLLPGDQISLSGLAAGMLLSSGNDAANAAALFLDGSLEAFAQRMNRRAQDLGLTGTHFVTPSGLDDEGHCSTAVDLGLLAREALRLPAFLELCSSRTWEAAWAEPEKTVTLENHNRLLDSYDGCLGVKTGYTQKAGRCLVSAARREGVLLIAVTLDAPDDWEDHKALLDYGFSQVERYRLRGERWETALPVAGGEREQVNVAGELGEVFALAPGDRDSLELQAVLPRFLYAPVEAGETVGELRALLDGAVVSSVPLQAAEDCPSP